jgi:hypothetical protein
MTTELRSAMLLVCSTCQTLVDRLDPHEPDQMNLIERVQEVHRLIEIALRLG